MKKTPRAAPRPDDPDRAQKAGPLPRAADRIRSSAQDLFYHQGIRAVGVDAIVAEAGVTKPSLYRSFGSKDDLVVAYLRDYETEFWRRFEAAVEAHPGDPRDLRRPLRGGQDCDRRGTDLHRAWFGVDRGRGQFGRMGSLIVGRSASTLSTRP